MIGHKPKILKSWSGQDQGHNVWYVPKYLSLVMIIWNREALCVSVQELKFNI